MAAFTVLLGTDSSCLQVRDLKCFIYSADQTICLNTSVMNKVTTAFRILERQNQKWCHNTGRFHHSWQPVFKWMSPVEACPIHHTVKQLTMTLKALLASAESARLVRALAISHTALTAAPVDLKINANHFSFSVSVSALNPSWLYRQLDVPCCPVHSAQLWSLNMVVNLWTLTM